MKTRYLFVNFKRVEQIWVCSENNSDVILGCVQECPNLRRWCFYPSPEISMTSLVLTEVLAFIKELETP